MYMVRILLILFSLLSFTYTKYDWEMISGDFAINRRGIYSIDPPRYNHVSPGARHGSSMWFDEQENIYIFGGNGYDSKGKDGKLNDFWVFNIDSNTWTYIGGDEEVFGLGNYENSDSDYPMNRDGAASWFDPIERKLWLFGGQGRNAGGNNRYINDFWFYSIDDEKWTWEGGKGDQVAGVYSGDNKFPSSRKDMVYWIDVEGRKLYLSGGVGVTDDNLKIGSIYDIWYFDLTTNKWEIVIHSTETGLSMNIDTGDSIHPGARRGHISWYDFDENKVYIYGGFGYKGIKSGYFNDLWSFDIDTKVWEVLTDTDTIDTNVQREYMDGELTPGSRHKSATFFDNVEKRLYLFGGEQTGSNQYLNDIWYYDLNTNEWSYVTGNDEYNALGKIPCIHGASYPGSRIGASIVLMEDQIILFGGKGYDYMEDGILNDMWLFNIRDLPGSGDDGDDNDNVDVDDADDNDGDGSKDDSGSDEESSSLSKYDIIFPLVLMIVLSVYIY